MMTTFSPFTAFPVFASTSSTWPTIWSVWVTRSTTYDSTPQFSAIRADRGIGRERRGSG
jgi:hypothetical protein